MKMQEEDYLSLYYYGLEVRYKGPEDFDLVTSEEVTVCFLHYDTEFPVNLTVVEFIRVIHALSSAGMIGALAPGWFGKVVFDHCFTIEPPKKERVLRPEGDIASTPPIERLDWLVELYSEYGETTFAPLCEVLSALQDLCDEGHVPPIPESWFEQSLPAERRRRFEGEFDLKVTMLRDAGEDPLHALLGDKLSPLPRKGSR